MLNIMNPPADWSTMKKLIWLRGTPISGGEELTVSGTPPLSLPNSLGKPLKAWAVDLLPYQEGTGDPAPDNVRAIHGTDKINIMTAVNGDNQYNKDTVVPNVYLDVDGVEQGSQSWTVSEYISVCGGATYTISGYYIAGNAPYCCWYDFNKTFIGSFHLVDPMGASGTSTITAPANALYLRMSIQPYYTGTTKLEFGSLRTAYTPYVAPSQTVITLPSTVYTATIGSGGGESRTAVVDLGTLNWVPAANADVFYTNGLNRANLNTASAIYRCEKYVYRGIAPGNSQAYINGNNSFSVYSGADARIWIRDDAYWGDIAAFKASLQGVLLEYQLVTPQTFPITSVTIPTPTGTATTWATAEDGTVDSMDVTYVGKA